jgi:DNA mismatch repair protein MSH6
VILFFKMGKFYELFHMDADIAVAELNIIYMKGEMAHAGFPEVAYGRYSSTLVEKGYKVARIEQTETPAMMEERLKSMGRAPAKFERVVEREVCQVSTKGTRVNNYLDSENFEGDPRQVRHCFLAPVVHTNID